MILYVKLICKRSCAVFMFVLFGLFKYWEEFNFMQENHRNKLCLQIQQTSKIDTRFPVSCRVIESLKLFRLYFRHLGMSYALATTGAVGTALTINNMVKVIFSHQKSVISSPE